MLPLRIGLTGGIGSGKSTVSALLAAHGATVIDTDAIAHQLTAAGGAAIDEIRARFGSEFIAADGSLARPRMRAAVFADAGLRAQLEQIVHPLIGSEVERRANEAVDACAIVFDIPLLVESGRWRARVERVWVVDCDEATQVRRVVARSGWSEDAVRAVIAQQATRAARRAAADAVIDNGERTLDALAADVAALWEKMPTRRA